MNGFQPASRGLHWARWGFFLLLFAGAVLLVVHQQRSKVGQARERLEGVAHLMADRIARWRRDQEIDATLLGADPYLTDAIQLFFAGKEEQTNGLAHWLANLREQHEYENILLLDREGAIRLDLAGTGLASLLSPQAITTAMGSDCTPAMIDVRTQAEAADALVTYIVPLCPDRIASLVLVSNLSSFLSPLLGAWPAPSETAETLLLRQEGNEVLFINHRRKESAPLRRLPLNEMDVLAVRAMTSDSPWMTGRDYRGRLCLAVIQTIPGTSWRLVAKMDQAELFRESNRCTLLLLTLLACLAALAFLLFRGDARRAVKERLKLLSVLEQAGEMVLITNREGAILYVNQAFERTTGYDRGEVVGQNPRLLRSGAQGEEVYQALWQTILRGEIWRGRLVNRRKDGSLFTEAITIAPAFDDHGSISHFVAIKRDISERLALELQLQLSRKLESLGRLAGGIAHDYNNMLSVILGYGEMLQQTLNPDHEGQADLREMLAAAQRSAEITAQLLAFSRRVPSKPVILDAQRAIADLLRLLRPLLGDGVEVAFHPTTQELLLCMDPVSFDQILANLCLNARDAMIGSGKITLVTHAVEIQPAADTKLAPGRYMALTVQDTGCGMDQDTQAHIFEPFFSTKEEGKGTGLGLSVVAEVVRQARGSIAVSSTPGLGTLFTLHLPLASPMEKDEAKDQAPIADPMGQGETVLIVDDEAGVRQLLERSLTSLGYRPIAVGSPAEALALLPGLPSPPQLLLTDMMLPGMRGDELAAMLRQRLPQLRVLFCSGHVDDRFPSTLAQLHGELLRKPFTRHDLALSLRAALAPDPSSEA